MTARADKAAVPAPPILADAPEEVIAAFRALAPKMRKFALALPLANTQIDAAVSVGYAKITAKKNAASMAANPNVRVVVDWCCNRALQNSALEIERLKRELATICYSDPRELFNEKGELRNLSELPEGVARSVAGVEFGKSLKITLWDKNSAINTAFKLMDAFPRKDKNPLGLLGTVGVVVVPSRGQYQHPERPVITGEAARVKRVEPPKPSGKTFKVTKQG